MLMSSALTFRFTCSTKTQRTLLIRQESNIDHSWSFPRSLFYSIFPCSKTKATQFLFVLLFGKH